MEKKAVLIVYCPKCKWMLRAAYMAQEILSTFENEIEMISLKPGEVNGEFYISVAGKKIFDRKDFGGFPEIKELKQWIRDEVAPDKDLGHADTPVHHQN